MKREDWNLEGYKAVVTGGTKGLGRAITEALCEFGAEVLIIARKRNDLNTVSREFKENGYKIHTLRADLSRPAEREAILGYIHERWDGMDILINNVGTNIRKKAGEYDAKEFTKIFQTNLDAAFRLSTGMQDLLSKSGRASVINISSVAGLGHMRTGIVYGMTKAAMIQMTKNLAVEWASQNIRVNAIAPWYIRTPLAEQVLGDPVYRDEVLLRTPAGKIGEPEDVASLAVFLCLPAAKYITGQCIAVDGGMSVNLF